MIVLNLGCSAGHCFEGWFASSDDFDRQLSDGQVACPHCGAASISKLPNSPRVRRSESSDVPVVAELEQKLLAHLRQLGAQAEDVGGRFATEARRIHYEEVAPKSIRGTASLDETRELLEEGIAVLPLPHDGLDKPH